MLGLERGYLSLYVPDENGPDHTIQKDVPDTVITNADPSQYRLFSVPFMPSAQGFRLIETLQEWSSLSSVPPETEADHLRRIVFEDLHDRGYFISSGLKFGGDYLVYPGLLKQPTTKQTTN